MSREIDREVAEKVFNADIAEYDADAKKLMRNLQCIPLDVTVLQLSVDADGGLWRRTSRHCWDKAWSPSTDISAAFEVVEEMSRRGFEFNLHAYPDKFTAMFECNRGGWFQMFEADSDVASVAICRAALRALEVVKEDGDA